MKSGSRRSCASTPAARRPSPPTATPSATCSATSTGATRGSPCQLLTDDGSLHRFVNVYVNDEDVRFLGALDAKLADGDVVAILPAVAGG